MSRTPFPKKEDVRADLREQYSLLRAVEQSVRSQLGDNFADDLLRDQNLYEGSSENVSGTRARVCRPPCKERKRERVGREGDFRAA